LVRSLLEQDLLDELRLLVYPLVRGEGKRLFVDMAETKLSLVETRTFASGVVALIYGRAGKKGPKPAPKASAKRKPAPKRKPAGKRSKGIGDRLRYGR